MRCLRRATAAAFLGLLLGAAPAYAGDLAAAITVANSVYPGVPRECGTVRIDHAPLAPPNDTNDAIAEAFAGECRVTIKPGIAAEFSDAQLCSLVTHEWGHLARRTFPENPGDPAHSLDPTDNMYGPSLVHHPACGESDAARAARLIREANARVAAQDANTARDIRLGKIADKLDELRDRLRAAKAGKRRSRGTKRAGYARKIRKLRREIRRLRAEYRSLAAGPTA